MVCTSCQETSHFVCNQRLLRAVSLQAHWSLRRKRVNVSTLILPHSVYDRSMQLSLDYHSGSCDLRSALPLPHRKFRPSGWHSCFMSVRSRLKLVFCLVGTWKFIIVFERPGNTAVPSSAAKRKSSCQAQASKCHVKQMPAWSEYRKYETSRKINLNYI